ncbi:MAG: DUF5677 domain-containing protein [Candidatus Thorarchaeota archaeon]
MKRIINNLNEINQWLHKPLPKNLTTNDDFMRHIIDLMNGTNYLLKTGCSLAPSEKISNLGYTKHKAIIVGHMVRLAKLYQGFLQHIAQRELELSAIFCRLIYECTVMIEYFMQAKSTSFRSYILSSYKSVKHILNDYKKKKSLDPHEKKIKKMMIRRLKKDKISQKELFSNRRWKIDDKNFRDILRHLHREHEYYYVFGESSTFIHGSWYEMSIHNLNKSGCYYQPNLDFETPDPRITLPITLLSLEALYKFTKWNRSDPDCFILPIIEMSINKCHEINRLYSTDMYSNSTS